MYANALILDEQSKISPADKEMVRENILGFVTQVPPLLRYGAWESVISYNHHHSISMYVID